LFLQLLTLLFSGCMQAVALFKSYFGGAFDEDAIRNNFVLIYELLDGIHLKPIDSYDCIFVLSLILIFFEFLFFLKFDEIYFITVSLMG